MVISAPRTDVAAGRLTCSSRVRFSDEAVEIWVRGPESALLPRGADAFLIACLPSAMTIGGELVVEATVSPRLLAAVETVQDVYCSWYPRLKRVHVRAGARAHAPAPAATAGASFFSGGVDSFYTAYKRASGISSLVLVHGFDLALGDESFRARVGRTLSAVADRMGKQLVQVETNSRQVTDAFVSWTNQQFGPALASIAVLLGGVAGRVYIPASETYAHLDPCGSHPLVDPLWSTEEIDIVHDGAEASRNQKVAVLAGHPEALRSLRVCWENRDGSYNCGRCEKCLRTMVNLEIAGALEGCTSFDGALEPRALAAMTIPNGLVFHHVAENLALLREGNHDSSLAAALEKAVARYRADRASEELLDIVTSKPATLAKAVVRDALKGTLRRARLAVRR